MIKIVHGDLLSPDLPEKRIIAHGCNAQGVMGSGVALEIKNRYPDAYADYIQKCHSARIMQMPILGTMWTTTIGDTTVANCISQQYYGRDKDIKYVSYDAVDTFTQALGFILQGTDFPLHMPLIGGGLANGNRDILMAIFEANLKDTDTTIFIKE